MDKFLLIALFFTIPLGIIGIISGMLVLAIPMLINIIWMDLRGFHIIE